MSPKIATGVYWKPVFNLLEGNFEVLVVNAQHIKAVPGRKTDVKDADHNSGLPTSCSMVCSKRVLSLLARNGSCGT